MCARTTELKPVYLIVSEQRLLVDQALDRLRARLGAAGDMAIDAQTFDAEGADPQEVIAACNTLPFVSDKRLVVVTNVERAASALLDVLAAYARDPSPTTVLAVAGAKLAKNTRLYKAIDALGGVVERRAPKSWELPRTVQELFADRGKRIDPEAAEALVRSAGRDLQQIVAEIDKVIAYVGTGASDVSLRDIEAITAPRSGRTVFEYADAIADRDCRRALALIDELLGGEHTPYALHAVAVRAIRDLIAAQSVAARGGGLTEVAAALGRPEWQVKRLPGQAAAFDAGELVDLLRSAAQAEAEMKTGRDARLVLETWTIEACGAA